MTAKRYDKAKSKLLKMLRMSLFMNDAEKEIIDSKIGKLKENIEVWNNNKELLLKEFEPYKGKETPLKSISPSDITRYIDKMLQTHSFDFAAELYLFINLTLINEYRCKKRKNKLINKRK